jgi:hypothetical protein
MTRRVLVIGILCGAAGFIGLTLHADAQSSDDEEDMSTGEISEETSSTGSISNDTSSDDDFSDSSFAPDAGDHRIGRPRTPLQPTQPPR